MPPPPDLVRGCPQLNQLSPYTPASLIISANPSTLAPGTYSGTVIVNSDGASNAQQSITVNLTGTNAATFTKYQFVQAWSSLYQVNSAPPAPQAFVVSSDYYRSSIYGQRGYYIRRQLAIAGGQRTHVKHLAAAGKCRPASRSGYI